MYWSRAPEAQRKFFQMGIEQPLRHQVFLDFLFKVGFVIVR